MPKDTAISVKNVFKTFRIPHEKISSLRGAFVGMFKHKTYEEFQALNNVSFEVKKGEFFGIIGRNGSGKSTLLKVLAGIYQPDSGSVEVNGMISPFLELGIGFNPELSGRDNVYLNATVLGLTRKQIDKKFDSIVAFSELERFIDQKLKNYSSGMQVRLAFAVSIHANRDILLMDEVLAVGDSNFQSKCIAEFEEYKKMGKTIILITHDNITIEKYCDRVLLLRNGKSELLSGAKEAIRRYAVENYHDISSGHSQSGRYFQGDVEFSDYSIHGPERNAFLEKGKKFFISWSILAKRKVRDLVVGAMFEVNRFENIFGIHSIQRDRPVFIPKLDRGEKCQVTISGTLPLNPGVYFLRFYAVSQKKGENYFTTLLSEEYDQPIIVYGKDDNFWGPIFIPDSSVKIKLI